LKKNFNLNLGHHGFTIVEIMVAMMLLVLIFGIIPMTFSDNDRAKLEETVFDIDRAVRFAVNESILRNAVTRLLVDMDSQPMEYIVEYGSTSNFILPEIQDETKMSLKERETQLKQLQSIDSQFNRVDEFSEKSKKLPEGVTILGIASSYFNTIKRDGKIAIYFFPTGEKDNAIIFFGTKEEISWLNIPPFENTTTVDYYTLSQTELVNLEDSQDNKMKEVYDQWLKN
jgi:prepilin-type N-terminal cleavage/methylation domain-containing protein